MSNLHSAQTENHIVEAYTYANAAARTGATGLLPADVGKLAFQQSDSTYWRLTDDSPLTWLQITGVGAGGTLSDGDKGDITVSGSGAVWTIDNDAVNYAKIQNVSATDKLLGRSTAGAGDVEEITCTAAGRAILDDADAAAQRTTLGAAASAHTHTVTDTAGGPVIEIPQEYGWTKSGALAVETFGVPVYYIRADLTIVGWAAYVVTAPSGSAATFDVEYSTNNGGSWATVFSSAPSISAAANFNSSTSGISVTTLAKGNLVRAKCTAANSAADLSLFLLTKTR